MFDNSPIPSERNTVDLTFSQLRDGLSSISHRVAEIESLLNKKVRILLQRWIVLSVSLFAKKRLVMGSLDVHLRT